MNDLIITYILSFSSDKRHIGSEELYNQIGKNNKVSPKSFQRLITNAVEEYQEEQISKAKRGEKINLILSMNDGYFVPSSYETAEEALRFYFDRITKLIERKNKLSGLIKSRFSIDPGEKFNNEQLSMF